jgi:hypothetical protein
MDVLIEPVSYFEEVLSVKASISTGCCETHVAKCESTSTWRNAVEVNCLAMSARRMIFAAFNKHTLDGILLVGFASTESSQCVMKQLVDILHLQFRLEIMALSYTYTYTYPTRDVVRSRDTPDTTPVSLPALLGDFPRLLHKTTFPKC